MITRCLIQNSIKVSNRLLKRGNPLLNFHNKKSRSILPLSCTARQVYQSSFSKPRAIERAAVPGEALNENNSFLSALTNDLHSLILAKIPKGFENFYPKNSENNDDTKKTQNQESKQNKNSHNSNNGGDYNDPQNQFNIFGGILTTIILLTLYTLLQEQNKNGAEITWTEFRNTLLESGEVQRIEIVNKKTARVYLHNSASVSSTTTASAFKQEDTIIDMPTNTEISYNTPLSSSSNSQNNMKSSQSVVHFTIGSVESFEEKLMQAQKELQIQPRDFIPVQYVNETNYVMELIKYSPYLLTIGLIMYFTRRFQDGATGGAGGVGGGFRNIFQIGKSNAKKIKKENVDISFKDVAGCDEAKKEIMEFVEFLQDSSRFTKLGAKIPKGALLCGSPGTGKTLLAKAVAGEANVPFYSISGSDFVEMFVGVGPSRVRDLFKEARANAPCILFIDEIDAVGRKRGKGRFAGGNDERENTLNQLLVEMDGFTPSTAVVVLAGTNRVDILDNALTRPGRFDRTITVDLPDIKGRKEIFLVHLDGITLEDSVDDIAYRLAGLTPGFSGADIANLCNEAAIQAARRKADAVSIMDFEKATERVIGGLESHKLISKEEREIVAYHEAGHAVAGWFLEHADPLLKLTIIPRSSGALGFAQYLPKEIYLRTQEQIMDIVCMSLAGRAAEEVFFGRITTGATSDLQKVTSMVYNMIKVYGMNNRLGQLAFPPNQNNSIFGEGAKQYSDATAQAMDEEAKNMVDAAYQRTLELVAERKEEVEKVAKMLLDKETITHDDVVELIGARPFEMDKAYEEYVTRKNKDDQAEKTQEDDGELSQDIVGTINNRNSNDGFTPGLA